MTSAHEFDDTSVCSDALSLSLKIENASSYGGIYSNMNEDESITDFSINNTNKRKAKNKKSETFPVTFQWEKEENCIVYLTGSFCNWKQYFIMPQTNNIYSLTLPLPRALHKFKFRINDEYLLSKKYPTMKDEDSYCNYIDTSNVQQSQSKNNKLGYDTSEDNNSDTEKEEKKSDTNSDSSSSHSYYDDFDDEDENSYKKRKKRIKKMKNLKYSQNFPKKTNLNDYAPDVPYSYNYMYNIDVVSKQGVIGKIKYYEPKENNMLGDNCSYKKIGVLPAVEINHIHSNETIVSGKRVLCSSFTRYRNKFITFLYYKPFE
jgi:hypothetical protein